MKPPTIQSPAGKSLPYFLKEIRNDRPSRSAAQRAAALFFAALLANSIPAWSQNIDLGSAETFTILAKDTVTNTGPTVVTGSVGVSPGTAITGFPPGVIINGTQQSNNALAAQARLDAASAYAQVLARPVTFDLSGQDLAGMVLTPGTYHFDTDAQLTGTLSLNTLGDPAAAFHFQIGSTLTTAAASHVNVLGLNGGTASNIFWQVGSSATLGSGADFDGTLLAFTSVTLNTGAILDGRAFALNGAVTLDTNVITPPPVIITVGTVWNGSTSNLWSGTNWSLDTAGATSGTLAPVPDVVFSVTGVAPQNQATILDANTTISSLTVNDSAAVTISGPNTLTINGAGLNTGITINNGAGLATINTALVLSGASQVVTVNNAAGLLLNGPVSGTIGLTKAGTGQLTLSGANTYSGATTLLQGTLNAGAASVIPISSAVLVNAGSTFALNNFNQSIGSLEGAGAVDLGTAAFVTGNNQSSTVYSGVLSGTGSVEKVGAGTMELTGLNTYTGLTTVSAGTLTVDGAIAGSALIAGGTLRGSGTIGGDVVNNAALNPGRVSAPGTLTVGGTFTQNPSGQLNIRLASPTIYDRLTIGGAAHLGGTLNVTYLDGFDAEAGDVLTILTAGGGVSGRFATFNDQHPTGTVLTLRVVYQSSAVLLKFAQGSFAEVAAVVPLTADQLSVAKRLDGLASDQFDNKLIQELNTYELSELPNALSLLSSEDLTAIFTAGLAVSQVQIGNLEHRLGEVRQGSTGFSDSGYAVSDARGGQHYDGKSSVGLDGKGALALDGKESKELVETSTERDRRWGFFISGTGALGDLESTETARGSSFTTGGVTVGADYRVNNHLVVGAAVGYANTSSDLSRGGSLDLDSGKGSLYATVYDGGFYVNGIVGAGYGSIDTRRRTLGGFAYGETDAIDFNALLGTGYDHHLGAFTVGPVASIQFGTVGIDSFSEHGALGAMHVDSQSQDSLKSAIGVKASYTKAVGRMVFRPEIRAQWQHEYLDSASGIEAGFSPGNSFTTYGPRTGRDGLLVDAGISAQLSPALGIFAFYTGELGRENYTVHSINAGLRLSF